MNLMKKVKNLWVLERHPKGALAVRPLMDVLERNYQRWATRAQDPGWEPLGVFPTLESGQEGERTLKRRYAEMMKKAEDKATGGQGPACLGVGAGRDKAQESTPERKP